MGLRIIAPTFLISGAVCLGAPPPGFELVEVKNGYIEAVGKPEINNCGQVVFSWGYLDSNDSEVFLYDNGALSQITDNDFPDSLPDINDDGIMVWTVGYDGWDAGEIVISMDGDTIVLGDGHGPHINNPGHVVWYRSYPGGCGGANHDVYFYDGNTVEQITDGGTSHQGPKMNDLDEIVWTHYDFCVTPWESDIMLYREEVTTQLTDDYIQPQIPTINNQTMVAWGGPLGIELWEDGVTTPITAWGRNPSMNNHGDIFFLRWHDSTQTWQGWLYHHTGEFYQLTDDPFSNTDGDMNDWGEITWRWRNLDIGQRGARLLRRIRNGDVNFNGNVDLDDFATLPDCMTGPVETDRLCECRFFDMDHDRDVDLRDFALFQAAFGMTR